MKKFITIMMIAVIVSSMLMGCGKKGDESAPAGDTGVAADNSACFNETGYPIVKDTSAIPAIKVYKSINELEPENPNENVWMKQASEDTGVTFEWTTVPDQSSAERVQMMLATNDLPDVFWNGVGKEQVLQYIDSGMFMPVEDLVEKYMPNLKKIFDERPEYKALCFAPDGHMYGFPRVEEMNGLTSTPGSVYVNEQWLQQLGLSTPVTLEEWINMLYKMKEAGDLNGNGTADEYPISWDYSEGWDNLFAWVSGSYGTPDVTNGKDSLTNHLYIKDGKIGYVPTLASYQKTAELFHQFYKDGILNPDSFAPVSTGTSLHKQKLQQELPMIGTFMAWGLDGNITNAEVKSMYAPQPRIQGPDGKSGYIRNTSELSTTTLGVITTNCKNPELIARFIDYCYEPKNSITLNWGAEGFVYKEDENGVLRWDVDENGNMIFKNDLTEFWQMRSFSTIGGPNIVLNDYYDVDVEYPRDAQRVYDEQVAGGKKELLEEYEAVSPAVWFLPEEQSQLDQLLPQINNVVDATIQTWIIDGGADTGFEQFTKDLNSAGLQTFLEVYQKAYDRYLANMNK